MQDRLRRAAEKMDLSIEETMLELLERSLDMFLNESVVSKTVTPEAFFTVDKILNMSAKELHEAGLVDAYWKDDPDRPTEKEIFADMRARREKAKGK